MFKIDELVVYPSQGVGRVEAIKSQEVAGIKNDFYVVRILSNEGTLMVPVDNAMNVGLRAVCDEEYGWQVLQGMQDRTDFKGYAGQNWNRRYREYSDKLKSGDLADVAYVLKELFLISQDKELSFGERRLLEQAMGLITLELSCALHLDQNQIQVQIEDSFSDILKTKETRPL